MLIRPFIGRVKEGRAPPMSTEVIKTRNETSGYRQGKGMPTQLVQSYFFLSGRAEPAKTKLKCGKQDYNISVSSDERNI